MTKGVVFLSVMLRPATTGAFCPTPSLNETHQQQVDAMLCESQERLAQTQQLAQDDFVMMLR